MLLKTEYYSADKFYKLEMICSVIFLFKNRANKFFLHCDLSISFSLLCDDNDRVLTMLLPYCCFTYLLYNNRGTSDFH